MAGGNSTWERSRGEGRHTCRPKSKKENQGNIFSLIFFFFLLFFFGLFLRRHVVLSTRKSNQKKVKAKRWKKDWPLLVNGFA